MDDSNISKLVQPGEFEDQLSDLIRKSARRVLSEAIEIEVEQFIAAHAHLKTSEGRQRVVRHGHLPEREIQTGVGSVTVKKPRVRDREGLDSDKIRYTSSLLPPYIRRSQSLDELLPALYLRGISTKDFKEVLSALLGANAPNLSPSVILRLKKAWQDEWKKWRCRDLSAKNYLYFWADGIYLNARMDDKSCILVILGVTPEGKKELVGFTNGYRESAQSWRELLVDLKDRGLKTVPKLAIGDGAMGFWKALKEVFSSTRCQRCWVHKTMNVLNNMPKSVQSKAKTDLHEIWMAETRKDADKAFDLFIKKYRKKYDKATDCLQKDREELLAFYDFPAEHWKHIRTTNPIESIFSVVRHRTIKTKGSLSRKTALTMVFKLVMAAQKRWSRISGRNELPKLIEGVKFADGNEVKNQAETKDEDKQYAA